VLRLFCSVTWLCLAATFARLWARVGNPFDLVLAALWAVQALVYALMGFYDLYPPHPAGGDEGGKP
jgi:hypothetical protein